jgi:hypothetical protein
MKRIVWGMMCVCLMLAGSAVAKAQDKEMTGMHHPPAVLTVMREWVKPGKSGAIHEKTESMFIQAFAHAKYPTNYIGMESLSGKSRALFLTGYDSFAAWETDSANIAKNAALTAAIGRASDADGTLLDGVDQATFVYRGDLSLRDAVDLSKARYFDIGVFHIKQGHGGEFEETVKKVRAAFEKANPDEHWATYQIAYGQADGTYLFITLRHSASEIDSDFSHNKDFAAALGEEGMKKLDESAARCIESSENQLFQINPNMSYVGEDLIKADAFWKPKMGMAPAAMPKKAEAKPSGN